MPNIQDFIGNGMFWSKNQNTADPKAKKKGAKNSPAEPKGFDWKIPAFFNAFNNKPVTTKGGK